MPSNNILLMTGGGFHDFANGAKVLSDILTNAGYAVTATEDRGAFTRLSNTQYAAVVVYTQGGKLSAEEEKGLLQFVRSGGGFVGIHCANDSWKENAGYMEMLGSSFKTHGPQAEVEIELKDGSHMVSRHFLPFRLFTELYQLNGDITRFHTLLHANWQGKMEPVAYVKEYGQGRVFYYSLGHSTADFANPEWQKTFLRGARWATGFVEKPTVKVGVIGYGGAYNMGQHHLSQMRDAGLVPVAACDIDPKRVAIASKDFPGIETYTDIGEMLKKTSAELITVILPHNLHAAVAIEVLNSGRHCIVEKPMALSGGEVDEMIAAARKNNRMLSVFHNRRWDGDFLTLQEVITRRGYLGDVFKMEFTMTAYDFQRSWWRSSKEISGGAHFDWGAHYLYWALDLLPGKIDWVVATSQDRVWHSVSNEDHVEAYIKFTNNVVLTIEFSSITKLPKPRWRISGTRGGIQADWGDSFKLYLYDRGITTREPATIDYFKGQHQRYYENIADHLRLGDPLEITAEKAGRVIRVLETIDRAARSGKQEQVPGEAA